MKAALGNLHFIINNEICIFNCRPNSVFPTIFPRHSSPKIMTHFLDTYYRRNHTLITTQQNDHFLSFLGATDHSGPRTHVFLFKNPVYKHLEKSLREGSARHKASTYKGQNKHRNKAYTLPMSRFGTHDPGVRVAEDNTYFRPRGHFDRQSD